MGAPVPPSTAAAAAAAALTAAPAPAPAPAAPSSSHVADVADAADPASSAEPLAIPLAPAPALPLAFPPADPAAASPAPALPPRRSWHLAVPALRPRPPHRAMSRAEIVAQLMARGVDAATAGVAVDCTGAASLDAAMAFLLEQEMALQHPTDKDQDPALAALHQFAAAMTTPGPPPPRPLKSILKQPARDDPNATDAQGRRLSNGSVSSASGTLLSSALGQRTSQWLKRTLNLDVDVAAASLGTSLRALLPTSPTDPAHPNGTSAHGGSSGAPHGWLSLTADPDARIPTFHSPLYEDVDARPRTPSDRALAIHRRRSTGSMPPYATIAEEPELEAMAANVPASPTTTDSSSALGTVDSCPSLSLAENPDLVTPVPIQGVAPTHNHHQQQQQQQQQHAPTRSGSTSGGRPRPASWSLGGGNGNHVNNEEQQPDGHHPPAVPMLPSFAHTIGAYVRKSSALRSLDLAGIPLGTGGMDLTPLADALAYGPDGRGSTVQVLTLDRCKLTTEALQVLCPGIAQSNVSSLSLRGNAIDPMGAAVLAGLFVPETALPASPRYDPLWRDVVMGKRPRGLVVLDVSDNSIGRGIRALGIALATSHHVKHLLLSNNGINGGALAMFCQAVRSNRSVELIDLSCNMFGHDGKDAFHVGGSTAATPAASADAANYDADDDEDEEEVSDEAPKMQSAAAAAAAEDRIHALRDKCLEYRTTLNEYIMGQDECDPRFMDQVLLWNDTFTELLAKSS
ncbi:hypothetical protein AMAG_16947 [Allomyces macrogynus ATCC 38327]|uniref:GAT domain-containing protein n=1 Tax=Allomyces macrogynus (strain ATCC 38327) TaxID=578462 RepID=A0A0L0TDT3_ALLM3|nr:hypothetical protein AMAG_16947 [Allomyces macrogynus ATCC 38327]|eukprot:KNE72840.1 hypothetical protein AMAG_16947 [Allomyces macrogynus ATCC 38327]